MDSLFIQHDISSIPVVHFNAQVVTNLANGSHVKMIPVPFIMPHVIFSLFFKRAICILLNIDRSDIFLIFKLRKRS